MRLCAKHILKMISVAIGCHVTIRSSYCSVINASVEPCGNVTVTSWFVTLWSCVNFWTFRKCLNTEASHEQLSWSLRGVRSRIYQITVLFETLFSKTRGCDFEFAQKFAVMLENHSFFTRNQNVWSEQSAMNLDTCLVAQLKKTFFLMVFWFFAK